jgi:hypothetical protein
MKRHGIANDEAETKPSLLPRETGRDIGMGSPVSLSAEAVSVITRLRNQKVKCLHNNIYVELPH